MVLWRDIVLLKQNHFSLRHIVQYLNNMLLERDHYHLGDGHFGAAHSNYNLNYKLPTFIPVVFHNLSGYDAHFICKNFQSTDDDGDCDHICNLLPLNKEKYISNSLKMA